MKKYYELTLRNLNTELFMTAAVMNCQLCDNTISGMGGPGYGCICEQCGKDLYQGKLRGLVKR